MQPGKYTIKVLNAKAYKPTTQKEIDETDGSHIDENYHSHVVELKETSNKAIINAGLYRKVGDITVEKEWVGGPENRPDIEIQLYRDGKPYGDVIVLKSGETSYTWKDLDLTDINGKEYLYTVVELNVPENYRKHIRGLKIINTYMNELVSTSIPEKGYENVPTNPEKENITAPETSNNGEDGLNVEYLPQSGVGTSIINYVGIVFTFIGVLLAIIVQNKKNLVIWTKNF